MSSSSSSKKHDVFISFRGEDTRTNFTSHLLSALGDNSIRTFIDYKLQKGDDVWPSLSQAIQDSHISIVVFSQNYASSRWCLEELLKIMECRKHQSQVVIPVFYEINPSCVRNQTGSYEVAFANHEQDLSDNDSDQHKLRRWRIALREAANISGWDSRSRTLRDDSQAIHNIVNDVLQKLYFLNPNELKGIVGIDETSKELELLLESFPIIGIWGMGGIGKTTIAKVMFAKLFPQYDSVCFLANIREESERIGLTSLREKLFYKLLKEEIPASDVVGSTSIMRRLSSKQVLIVLDDVDSFEQLEYLCGEQGDLGENITLIVTTRDRKYLIGRVDKIYEVNKRNNEESLELFSLNAFKKSHPQEGYKDLSDRAVHYAKGIPLALKVLGSHLYSRSHEFWENTLRKLEKYPNEKILNVLKVSYDGLDDPTKEIFLDIAFFFRNEDKHLAVGILDACDFFATSGIDVLVDKALITISYNNNIQIHDLLQEMGLDIVRKECPKNPGRRSRLRDNEVYDVLKNNRGTDTVEGIMLDLSQVVDLKLSADTFNKMPNLRFLRLYVPEGKKSRTVYCCTILEAFSDELRYFEWDGFPLWSLPPNFCAEHLVEIRMPHSHVKEFWQGVQDLVNLESIDLCECKQLLKLPDLSKASKLKRVYLSGCESLPDVHPSVLSLRTLETLILDRCEKLKSLKSESPSKSLLNISVHGCTGLEEFALSSDLIERLDLSKTGNQKLKSSIGGLSKLVALNLEGLHNLPDELSCLTSLKELRISHCLQVDRKKLRTLCGVLRNLELLYLQNCYNLFGIPTNINLLSSLSELRLDGSNIKSLPVSISYLPNLKILSLHGCRLLQFIHGLPPFIKELSANYCSSLTAVSLSKDFSIIQMEAEEKYTSFRNGTKLNELSRLSIMEDALFDMKIAALRNLFVRWGERLNSNAHQNFSSVKICLPGKRVPGHFAYRTKQSSLTIELPNPHSDLLGLVYSVVLKPGPSSRMLLTFDCNVHCQCRLGDGTNVGKASTWPAHLVLGLGSDHVLVWYDPLHSRSVLHYNKQVVSLVCFEFFVTTDTGEPHELISIEECGVHPLRVSWLEFGMFLRESKMDLLSSFSWKSIQQASWVIKKGSFSRVGDGLHIRVWGDPWLRVQSGHKVWSPKPASCDISHVYQLINKNTVTWDSALVRDTFLPFEAEQILQIPLLDIRGDDGPVWEATSTDFFSVKTAYRCIKEWERLDSPCVSIPSSSNLWQRVLDIRGEATRTDFFSVKTAYRCIKECERLDSPGASIPSSSNLWQRVWRLSIMPRQAHFIWRILQNSVPTRRRLWNRGVSCHLWCPRCDGVEESVDHVFMECFWSKKFWFGSPLGISWDGGARHDFVSWLRAVILDAPVEYAEQVSAMAYALWRARNKWCFEGQKMDERSTATAALDELREFQAMRAWANQNPQVAPNTADQATAAARIWRPLRWGWLK